MKKLLIASLFSTLATTQVLAAPQTYEVEPTHTYQSFSYDHMGFSTQQLRIDDSDGTVVYDKEAKTAEVDITIDMTSISTGFEEFDSHIQSEDFFDTEKFPTATFKSTKVVFDGDTPKSIEGDLTIKDVTKSVTLEVSHFHNAESPMFKKDAIGANASTTILRSDFGIDTFVPAVSDEVLINIAIEAIAK